MTAWIEGGRVVVRGREWREVFDLELLPRRLAFYRGLAARAGGRYAAHYAQTIAALESVEAQLEGRS
ncbi:hypothetical protein [Salipiger thiooxidans]|uniref:hypothetical protein n=1 Tax=Salipiger thiooxidans TaxID=282683 RepID=UPI001CD2A044|nr:hypothetical protein [Salipiger thiooxidans]MCA0851213.1 hypothetical protein [Salipiger thiooxidans]